MDDTEALRFHWVDYVVFASALLLSSAIGVFYGWRDRKDASTEGFLMAGRSMHCLPVSASLFVSWISAISFLGDPVEVYYYGAIYWVIGIGYALAIPIIVVLFVPLYYKLKLNTSYQVL
jgi:Na+/proline symporter